VDHFRFQLWLFSALHFRFILPTKGDKKMQTRLDVEKVAPAAYPAMSALETYVRKSSRLESSLLELVRLRASQINGCAFCIDMHTKDARANGESEQRLYALTAWPETPFFTDRERAALAWTEAMTLISQGRAPDPIYEEVRRRFTEEELVHLTLAIVAINGWNRLAIGFRAVPGEYQPTPRRGAEGGKQ
jgi:AhpD family alkylhydroperoxidase